MMFQRLIVPSAFVEDGSSSEIPFYQPSLLNGYPDHSKYSLNLILRLQSHCHEEKL